MASEHDDELRFSPDAPERRDAYPDTWDGIPHPRLHERARQGQALAGGAGGWPTLPPHLALLRPCASTGRRDVGTLWDPSLMRCMMEVLLGRRAIPVSLEMSTVLPSAISEAPIAEDGAVIHPAAPGTTTATERGQEAVLGYAWLHVVKWPYSRLHRFSVIGRPICRLGGPHAAYLLRGREISGRQFTYCDGISPFYTTVLVIDTLCFLT